MVAFRGLLAALPPWSSTKKHRGAQLKNQEALLAGKPRMEGPLITELPFNETVSAPQKHEEFSRNSSKTLLQTNMTTNTTLTPENNGLAGSDPMEGDGQQQQSKLQPVSPFTLYEWTIGFRESARLATSSADGTGMETPLTLTLTPGLRVEPPPYVMSRYGGGEDSKERSAAVLQPMLPAADYERGQLLLEAPPMTLTDSNQSSNDTTISTVPADPTEDKLITTAEWLVRPSNSVIFISKDLKDYLNNLNKLGESQQLDSGQSSFSDKVDLAISLSSKANLSTTVLLSHKSNHAAIQNNEPFMNATTTSVMQKTARIKAFAPNFFAGLRRSFGIDESSYWQSILDEDSPFISFQSNSKGARRVGGHFFFTQDGAYMIKTIKPDEVGSFLGTILPKYGSYMKQNGRTSLLTRFCGLYQVQLSATTVCNESSLEKSRSHTFAVMNSVFPAQASKLVSERFDLKGSTLGRQCSLEEIQKLGSNAILKDLDLSNEVELMRKTQQYHGRTFLQQKEGLHIGPSAKAHLMTQLARDVELLVRCNAIDYSLLVGVSVRKSPLFNFLCNVFVHHQDSEKDGTAGLGALLAHKAATNVRLMFGKSAFWHGETHSSSRNEAWMEYMRIVYDDSLELCGVNCGPLSRVNGERLGRPAVYYFGLIDFLQPFNVKKKAEYQWKSIKHGGPNAGFSCIPPHAYASRFLAFLDRHIT